MKVAIVYDRVNKWGGAERVLLTLHEMFPDAPLFTSVYDEAGASWAKVFPKIHTSFLQKIPFAKRNHEYFGGLMPIAFECFDFSNYDLVISVTSEACKGIITGLNTKHICYMLTPTRYLWSHEHQYFGNEISRTLCKPLIKYLKRWDKMAAQRPDLIVSISSGVQDRIKKYYGRESQIIFPPAGIASHSFFGNSHNHRGGYYLIVSRLVKYKKVDLAIEVFGELGLPLYVVGTGREEKKYREKYKFRNVKFLGFVPEKDLDKYYSGARALVMPQEEDFGLVAVEAQSYGVPVIAFKKGGAIDIIKEKTGFLFAEQSKKSLITAVKNFQKMKFDGRIIRDNAKRFSTTRFKKEFMLYLKEMNI